MRIERRLKASANVDLTPLIDVIFQLVIFFMITSVFRVAPGIDLQLPVSGTTESVSLGEMRIVAITEDEIRVNKVMTSLEGLDQVVASEMKGKDPKKTDVVFEGDSKISYGTTVRVLDALRKSGLEGVSFLTKVKKEVP